MNQSDSRIIKNSLWLYVRMLIVTLISLYTSRVVLKVLGFDDYGIYNLTGGIVAFLSILTSTMTNSTQRFLNKEKAVGTLSSLSRTMHISLKLHHFLAFLIFFVCETVGLFVVAFILKIPSGRYFAALMVYQASVLALIISMLQIPYTSLIVTYERFSFIAITGLVDVTIKFGFVIGLVFLPYDKLYLYGFSITLATLIQFFWYKYCCRNLFEKKAIGYRDVFKSHEGRGILSFSSWNILGSLGNMLATQGIGVIFNMYYPLVVNAALGVTTQVTNTIATFVNNVQLAFRPQLLQSYSKNDRKRFMDLVCNCSKWSFFLILFLAVPLICNLQWILELWLGKVPDYTAHFIEILIFYLIIDSLGNPIYYGIEAHGDIKRYQVFLFILLVSNVFAAWLCCSIGLSPTYSILTKLLTNCVVFMWRLIYLQMKTNFFLIIYYVRNCIIPSFLVAVVGFLFIYCFHKPIHHYHFLVTTLLYWTFLTGAILCTGISSKERHIIGDIIKKVYYRIK